MQIGVDFDNTIVRYDEVFHSLALSRNLIPRDLPVNKTAVREHLKNTGREDIWTAMQGEGYGPAIELARPFEGVKEFFRAAVARKIPIFIISHKTRHPYLGPPYDLHESATRWLTKQGFFDPSTIGLPGESVFLELNKQAKFDRIATQKITHFIDDLPEFLTDEKFPPGVERILFDPADSVGRISGVQPARSWAIITKMLLGSEATAR
jgi:hypothetical protein